MRATIRPGFIVLTLLWFVLACFAIVSHAAAATFVVNAADDVNDGSCDATHCSLREAMLAAQTAGPHVIVFNISGAGVHTITATSTLPSITDSVTIDGFSQPGSVANTNPTGPIDAVPLIEVTAPALGPDIPLIDVNAPSKSVVIRGLVVNGMVQGMVTVESGTVTVAGCFLGTTADGTAVADTTRSGNGVWVKDGSVTIGGSGTPDVRNVIAGLALGIEVNPRQSTANPTVIVQGNLIGTAKDGVTALGNTRAGILYTPSVADTHGTLTVGGPAAVSRNVISANAYGVVLVPVLTGSQNSTVTATIDGNLIGTNVSGGPLGNSRAGISVALGPDVTIGGGVGNVIAYNGRNGVTLFSRSSQSGIDLSHIRVLGNVIHDNQGLGIDIDDDGITPNDAGDADLNRQNYPVINQVLHNPTTTAIIGTLDSTPSTTFRIEFFDNDQGASQGAGSLGFMYLVTDANGQAGFSFNFSGSLRSRNDWVTATATDMTNGSTSEFSPAFADVTLIPNIVPAFVQPNEQVFYQATLVNRSTTYSAGGAKVVFSVPGGTVFQTTAGGIIGNGTVTYDFTGAALAAGASIDLTCGVTYATGGPHAATATVTTTVPDITTLDNLVGWSTTVNTAPTLTGLSDQTIYAGSTFGPIAFIVGDAESGPSALTMTATSSNAALVPNADLVLGGSGATRTLAATPVPGASGTTTMTVIVSDGDLSTQQTFTLTVLPAPVYYLAEGATGGFFSTDLLLANPNATPAAVVITFFKDDGTTVVRNLTLAATSRTTLRVNQIAGLEAAAFSTSVASTAPLVVERTMWWDASGYGASGEKATAAAATQWYFAEGSQGFFHTYFLLLNPHAVATMAHAKYFLEDGTVVSRDYTVAATSRLTVDAGTEPALANQSFGALITFDLPGMAERAMYFGDSPTFSGGHAAAGVTAPGTTWYLAEGATGTFFDTFVLIANPNDATTTITLTYLPEGGAPITRTHVLPGRQRLTINVADEDPALLSAAVSTRLDADQPIVVERSQYWPHPTWYEAHNSAGETTPGTKWGLAEGRVGGPANAQTYILIANPNAQSADLTATFLRADGTTVVKTFTVGPMSRFTIGITGGGSDVPELADESFGTIIASSQPVIVERSLYTDAAGVVWAAGTNATATRLP